MKPGNCSDPVFRASRLINFRNALRITRKLTPWLRMPPRGSLFPNPTLHGYLVVLSQHHGSLSIRQAAMVSAAAAPDHILCRLPSPSSYARRSTLPNPSTSSRYSLARPRPMCRRCPARPPPPVRCCLPRPRPPAHCRPARPQEKVGRGHAFSFIALHDCFCTWES